LEVDRDRGEKEKNEGASFNAGRENREENEARTSLFYGIGISSRIAASDSFFLLLHVRLLLIGGIQIHDHFSLHGRFIYGGYSVHSFLDTTELGFGISTRIFPYKDYPFYLHGGVDYTSIEAMNLCFDPSCYYNMRIIYLPVGFGFQWYKKKFTLEFHIDPTYFYKLTSASDRNPSYNVPTTGWKLYYLGASLIISP
jgi:hypothetical protein